MNIKTDILIYTAGYIDGDGCFNIRVEKAQKRYKYHSHLIVTSTDRPILQFFKEHLGGNFHPVNNREKRQREKIQYRFCLVGKKAIEIAQLIQTKKPVCEELIKFRKLVLDNGGARHTDTFRSSYRKNLTEREKIFKKTKQLNLRGFKSV